MDVSPSHNHTDITFAQSVAAPESPNLLGIVGEPAGAVKPHVLTRRNPMVADVPHKPTDTLPLLHVADPNHLPQLQSGDYRQAFQFEGAVRQFEMHVPPNYDGKSKLPVVYMLHGLTENMDMMREYSQMSKLADEKGFAVVYLQALKQDFPNSLYLYKENSWNLDHGSLTPKDPTYDDLDYMKKVKGMVESEVNIDPHRQYLAGFSEGGEAAQYIAHEMPHTFAGVGTVHSTLLDSDPRPRSDDPMAMISILGDDDNILPMNGDRGWGVDGLLKGWMTISIPKIGESQPLAQAPAWAAADGDTKIQASDVNNSMTTIYSGGAAPVEQIIRQAHPGPYGSVGGQHAWDGGNDGLKGEPDPDLVQSISRWVRHSDPDFDTSRTVVDFLFQSTSR